ncbi:MAG: hypothetical protein MK102_06300 [Fuerstiella sp.]|nr:hypothetical protein [Fuerstiella sp.]
MARRRNEKTISLFPFLAVLVCTMGALILLLLVTTRRIRQKQQATHVEMVVSDSVDDALVSDSASVSDSAATVMESMAACVELSFVRQQSSEYERNLEVRKRHYSTLLERVSRHTQDVADLHRDLEAEHQNNDRLLSDKTSLTRQLADLRNERLNLDDELTVVRQSIEESEVERSAAESLANAAKQLVDQRHSALRTLRDLSATWQDQVAGPRTTATFIDFSNAAGTARMPIVVDVTGSEFLFPATQVRIQRSDMKGASPTQNPLLSGVLAVHRERSTESSVSRPYVLLLVRPSGTLEFYVAQRIFKESHIHFGYELLEENTVIAAAQPVRGEAEALRIAVQDSLQRRNQQSETTSSVRQRIAALRDPRRSNPHGPSPYLNNNAVNRRRRYFGEPFGDADLDDSAKNSVESYAESARPEQDRPDRHESFGSSNFPGSRSDDAVKNAFERYAESVRPEQDGSDRHESFGSSNFPGSRSDDAASPSADFSNAGNVPTEVWRSIPSVAEAQIHVEGALAQALAAREKQQTVNPGTDSESGFSSFNSLNSRSTRNIEPSGGAASADTYVPDEPLNTSLSADSDVDEFWAVMQPLTETSSIDRTSGNPASGETQAARSVPDGQTYRSNETSTDAAIPSPIPMAGRHASSDAAGGNPSSGIASGLTTYKQITIYLDPQHFTIAGQQSVALHGQAIRRITNELSKQLFKISRENPHPLAEITVPAAKFVVSPGAHTLYLQLAAGLHRLKIPVSSIVTMDPFVTSRDAGYESVTKSAVQRSVSLVSDEGDLP